MDAIKCLISRRSIREYTDQPVTGRDVEDIVMMSQMASCWENTQPIRYVAVLNQELKDRLAKECTAAFLGIRRISMQRRRSSCSAS